MNDHPPGPPPIPVCPECDRLVSHRGHAPDCVRGQEQQAHWANVRAVESALADAIAAKRADREFMARLRRNIEKHADLLERLASGKRPRMTAHDDHPATPYDRERMLYVLIYHWRKDFSGCACGWAELGRSHPEHILDVYEQSMLAAR